MLSSKQSDDRLTPATFMNVTEMRNYVPSWLAPRRGEVNEGSPIVGAASSNPDWVPGATPEPTGSVRHLYGSTPPCQTTIRMLDVDDTTHGHSSPDLDSIQKEYRALEEAQHQTARLNAELSKAIFELQRSREQMLEDATRQIVDLAMLAARQVIAREATLHPGILGSLVREALRALADREPIKVRVGSGFEPAIASVAGSLALEGTVVEFGADAQLEEFGCMVQTDIASVDESLSSRFDALVDALGPGKSQ